MTDAANNSCLIVVNLASSRAGIRCALRARKELLSRFSDADILAFWADGGEKFNFAQSARGYSALAVCGGDGTLFCALNALKMQKITLYYYPCGTMNDYARTARGPRCATPVRAGTCNDALFSYVAATGTFTPIGYLPSVRQKRRFKRLAYYARALKEYKREQIRASLIVDGKRIEGTYTLIMLLRARYVFGLGLYRGYHGDAALLLIETPSLPFWRIKLFLRFFRAFFIGFTKETHLKSLSFLPCKRVLLCTDTPRTWCVDGEKFSADRVVRLSESPEES